MELIYLGNWSLWRINYCDDLIMYSKDKKSHLEHVKEVVKRLAANNLTVNTDKAKFFCNKISFLGNVIIWLL